MRQCVRWVLVFSCVALGGVPSAFAQGACDRTCLRGMLDQYLNAVIKHDPAAAPLAIGFRQTENAVNVRPGNGVWKSVTGLGGMQRRYVDAESGQAAYYGIVQEGADSAIVTVRVRVENRKLTEAEWYLARVNDPGLNGPRQPGRPPANLFNPDYLTANPPPERMVPRAQRLPREALGAITNSYFDAITSHDGSVALTHPGCGRVENGSPTPPGRFLPPLASAARTTNDCVAGLQNFNASMVVARRIPIIDEDAQAVLAFAVFIRRPGSPTPRNVFSEWFFIDEGRIRTIYTAMFYPPAELAVPNWPPYDGNWPLPATIVPAPAAAVVATLSVPAQAETCTRERLSGLVADYFKAVETHSMSALATAPNLRVTQNGLEIKAGDGFFQTGGKAQFQRNLIDTQRCGTLTQAVIEETADGATAPVIVAVRLKVDGGRVSEIETIVNRKGELFFNPQGVLETRSQDWEGILPPEQRSTREYLNDAANKYFDGFAADPKVEAPFATPCHRWEGGVQTTAKTANCSPKGLVLTHTHRRFPVTDLEAGITAGFINFNQSLPDVHMFKIRNGKIELIQAVFGGRTQDAIWPDEKK